MAEIAAAIGALVVSLTPLEASGAIALSLSTYAIIGEVVIAAASIAAAAALTPSTPSLSPGQQKLNIRQPVSPCRRLYGRLKVGGTVAFLEVRTAANFNKPGTDGHLFMVVLHAAHEIDGVEEYWLSDAQVTLTGGGLVNEAPFYLEGWRRAKLVTHLGADDQAAEAALITNFPGEWTSDDRLRGIAYTFGEFGSVEDKAFSKVFQSGIPAIVILGRFSKVWDPRESGLISAVQAGHLIPTAVL